MAILLSNIYPNPLFSGSVQLGSFQLGSSAPAPTIPEPVREIDTAKITTPMLPAETEDETRARQRWECKAYREWYVGLGPRPGDGEMYR